MKKTILLTFSVLIMFILSACGSNDDSSSDDNQIKIYTTAFPLTSFVEQIGGDTVEVESIYPNGVDIHTYEPTQRDMIEFAEGDLFIYTEDLLDPVSERIRSSIEGDTTFIQAADNISESDILEDTHDHDDHEHGEDHDEDDHHDHSHHETGDPHIWLDPVHSKAMAEAIKDALISINPDETALYTENFNSLSEDLDDISQSLETLTENAEKDTVYISHESIGYLADRYHFNQVGISGINNEEPSQHQLTGIIDSIEEENISYILYEQNIPSRIAETIQQETGTEMLPFHNLSVLTDEDNQDVTYQELMQENIDTLEQAMN